MSGRICIIIIIIVGSYIKSGHKIYCESISGKTHDKQVSRTGVTGQLMDLLI